MYTEHDTMVVTQDCDLPLLRAVEMSATAHTPARVPRHRCIRVTKKNTTKKN